MTPYPPSVGEGRRHLLDREPTVQAAEPHAVYPALRLVPPHGDARFGQDQDIAQAPPEDSGSTGLGRRARRQIASSAVRTTALAGEQRRELGAEPSGLRARLDVQQHIAG
ncbi:MAG: hypothetical protein KatS3mg059_0299 [Thermomicrobiales bacterium]|nr:MAG: hypothetical protein KatS3mg059_0299 [Thermomicrobiales bacterium]